QRDGRHGPSVIRRPSPRNTRFALPSSSFAFASAMRPYQRLSRKSIKSEDRHRHDTGTRSIPLIVSDAQLALTLRHHGLTEFATRNETHFTGFGFTRLWNPLRA